MTAPAGRPAARVLAWPLAGFVLPVMTGMLVLLPFSGAGLTLARAGRQRRVTGRRAGRRA